MDTNYKTTRAVPYKFKVWNFNDEKYLPTDDGIYFQCDNVNFNACYYMNKPSYHVAMLIGYDSNEEEVYTEDLVSKNSKNFLVSRTNTPEEISNTVKIGTFVDVGV